MNGVDYLIEAASVAAIYAPLSEDSAIILTNIHDDLGRPGLRQDNPNAY